MDRWETALWVLLALLIEKWLDYVERPKWLRRRQLKQAKKKKVVLVVKAPKPPPEAA